MATASDVPSRRVDSCSSPRTAGAGHDRGGHATGVSEGPLQQSRGVCLNNNCLSPLFPLCSVFVLSHFVCFDVHVLFVSSLEMNVHYALSLIMPSHSLFILVPYVFSTQVLV